MAVNLADSLVTDDLTILLGLIAATLFLLNNLYKPQPLVHPILLGRQSEAARVRYPGESAVYRNYSTGLLGRFPIRPSKEVHLLVDCVKPDVDTPRTLWSTKISNVTLQDRVAAFGTGLLRLAELKSKESDVLLLLQEGIEFVISDLALASHSIISYTLHSSDLLAPVLESRNTSAIITHAYLLPQLLELIYESEARTPHTIIVVGEPSASAMASVASQIKILKFSELEREGNRFEKILSPVPKSSDVFTVHLFRKPDGPINGAQYTHENFTAGVAATRLQLPLSQPISPLDTIISAHPVSSPHGRSILYTAIFEGTSFATTKSAKLFVEGDSAQGNVIELTVKDYPIPSPTIAFLQSKQLPPIVNSIKEAANSSLISSLAWRHKLAGLREGFITKDSLWDRLVFDAARTEAIGDGFGTLRAVIVNGGPLASEVMATARIALSVPLVVAFTHPICAGPILATNSQDLQDFPVSQSDDATGIAHSGPPSVNIEVKLRGVDDDAVEKGADPRGTLLVRGPPVGKLQGLEDYVTVPSPADDEGWLDTQGSAVVRPNGTLIITGPFI